MGTFREAVEEMEREEGRRLSNAEIRAFKDIWVKENPKASWKNPASHAPALEDPRAAYVRETYAEPAKKVTETARNIGEWLSKAKHHLLGSEDALDKASLKRSRTREHALNELNNLFTGESTEEKLLPEYGGKEPDEETIEFNFPGRVGSKSNPVHLKDAVSVGIPTNHEQGIEEMPEEVSKLRFRSGSRENPVRLPPINLPEDELRTDEVIINVPRKR